MKRGLVLVGIMALGTGMASADSLDDALATIGMHRSEARFNRHEMGLWGGDRLRLRWFDALADQPWRVPLHARFTSDGAVSAGLSVHRQLWWLTGRLDAGIRRGWIEDPQAAIQARLDGDGNPLQAALRELHEHLGAPLDEQAAAELAQASQRLDPVLRRALGRILFTLPGVLQWRELAFRQLPGVEEEEAWQQWQAISDLAEDDFHRLHWPDWVDFAFLYAGAMDLAQAVEAALQDLGALSPDADGRFRWQTPLGPVVVASRDDDRHDEDCLLLVDLGGDDLYSTAAGASAPSHPLAVLIDLGGNDTYDAVETTRGALAAGIGGYGLLYDQGGDDTYQAGSMVLGTGVFGVGALVDRQRNDSYQSDAVAQGAGQFGIGMVVDGAGDDRYEAFTRSQGYGDVRGGGLLLDLQGNDVYLANDTEIRYPSPQTGEHNASLCQGFGHGRRADYSDGHSLAGGIGLLIDPQGDDSYSCGVFGQGGGYWYGIGLLADGGGNDSYQGTWYVQATGAHFAVGILWDRAGEDTYQASHNMAQGAGHDFSLGFLLDDEGNDLYQAPNLSLGAGNANGIGIFIDRAGDDRYQSGGTTLGRSRLDAPGSIRESLLCLGLFLDLDGADEYSEDTPWAVDGRLWSYPEAAGDRPVMEKGVGADVAGGSINM